MATPRGAKKKVAKYLSAKLSNIKVSLNLRTQLCSFNNCMDKKKKDIQLKIYTLDSTELIRSPSVLPLVSRTVEAGLRPV
jgi:hypothetical protein